MSLICRRLSTARKERVILRRALLKRNVRAIVSRYFTATLQAFMCHVMIEECMRLPSVASKPQPTLWLQQGRLDRRQLQQTLQQLSNSEKQKLATIRSEKRCTEYLASRFLLRQALTALFDRPLGHWQPIEHPERPPEIPSLPEGWHLSLSHSHDQIALALYPAPVGVDIEQRRPRTNLHEMAKMICSPLEQKYLCTTSNPLDFYRIWCRKEAWYKQLSPLQQSDISLTTLCTESPNSDLSFFDWEKNGFQISLAVLKGYPRPCIETINLSSN